MRRNERGAFFSGAIGREKRAVALKAAFDGRASELIRNFLMVLNEHDRLNLLGPILSTYQELLEERTGKMRVQVLAPGFQTYGADYEVKQAAVEITVRLKKPAGQYSVYGDDKKQ